MALTPCGRSPFILLVEMPTGLRRRAAVGRIGHGTKKQSNRLLLTAIYINSCLLEDVEAEN